MSFRQDLIKKAKETLKRKGFADNEIYEEFWFKNYRVDVVGWNPKRKVAVECGYCSPGKKQDLTRFFDEIICLPFHPQVTPVSAESSRGSLSKMRLVLFKGDGVVFEVPLSREELREEFLENEIGFLEREFRQSSKLFNALSHENRLRMMKLLIKDEDLTVGFADFIHDLGLNPKLVWENTRKLTESGLLEKNENGRYRCSEFGEASFIMLSMVLRHLREMFEHIEGR